MFRRSKKTKPEQVKQFLFIGMILHKCNCMKCAEGGLCAYVCHWSTSAVWFGNSALITLPLNVCSLKATTASAPASPVLVSKPRPLSMALPSTNSSLFGSPSDVSKKRRAPQPPILVSQMSCPADLSPRHRLCSEPSIRLDTTDQVSAEWTRIVSVLLLSIVFFRPCISVCLLANWINVTGFICGIHT